jgi:hypothetical protein
MAEMVQDKAQPIGEVGKARQVAAMREELRKAGLTKYLLETNTQFRANLKERVLNIMLVEDDEAYDALSDENGIRTRYPNC